MTAHAELVSLSLASPGVISVLPQMSEQSAPKKKARSTAKTEHEACDMWMGFRPQQVEAVIIVHSPSPESIPRVATPIRQEMLDAYSGDTD
jgi:hypothetical protein